MTELMLREVLGVSISFQSTARGTEIYIATLTLLEDALSFGVLSEAGSDLLENTNT